MLYATRDMANYHEVWRIIMRSRGGVAREAEKAAREDKAQLVYHLRRIEYRLNMIKQLLK